MLCPSPVVHHSQLLYITNSTALKDQKNGKRISVARIACEGRLEIFIAGTEAPQGCLVCRAGLGCTACTAYKFVGCSFDGAGGHWLRDTR